MKLVFVAVSLIVVLTVDCRRSQPEPDPQHLEITEDPDWPESDSQQLDIDEDPQHLEHPDWPEFDSQHIDIAEDPDWPESDSQNPDNVEDPQWTEPGFPLGPFTTEETTEADSIISESDWSDFEEEMGQSDIESRGSGCKPNIICKTYGGKCVSSASQCQGKILPGGCKGGSNCICCIPGCPFHLGYFQVPGPSNQCFKLFTDQRRNFTESWIKCRSEGLDFAILKNDPLPLRDYITLTYGNTETWLNACGMGSNGVRWGCSNSGVLIPSNNPLWYLYNNSTSTCLDLRTDTSYWKPAPNQPFYMDGCSHRHHYALCTLPLE